MTTEGGTNDATTLSRMNISGYVWHLTIMLNVHYRVRFSSRVRVRIRVRIRFCVWSVLWLCTTFGSRCHTASYSHEISYVSSAFFLQFKRHLWTSSLTVVDSSLDLSQDGGTVTNVQFLSQRLLQCCRVHRDGVMQIWRIDRHLRWWMRYNLVCRIAATHSFFAWMRDTFSRTQESVSLITYTIIRCEVLSWSSFVNVYILLFIYKTEKKDRFDTLVFWRQLSIAGTTQQTD